MSALSEGRPGRPKAAGSLGRRGAAARRVTTLGWLILLAVQAVWGSDSRLAQGKLLVASRRLGDPNFVESVVLLIEYGAKGALGLVLNRPSQQGLSALVPQGKELEEQVGQVFWGGPVARRQLLMLLRSDRRFEADRTKQVAQGLYVSASRDLLERLLAKGDLAPKIRVYAGSAGWGAGQLEGELFRGDWLVLPYEEEIVFSDRPGSVWKRLIDRGALILAQARPSP